MVRGSLARLTRDVEFFGYGSMNFALFSMFSSGLKNAPSPPEKNQVQSRKDVKKRQSPAVERTVTACEKTTKSHRDFPSFGWSLARLLEPSTVLEHGSTHSAPSFAAIGTLERTVTGPEKNKGKSGRMQQQQVERRRVRLKRTNLRVKGLSLNRSQKWTALLSTTPRLRPRSSTNDLAPLHRTWLLSLSARGRVVSASARSRRAVALPPRGPKSVAPRILSPADVEALTVSSRLSGRDSDLEAFSHNPSDGSFAPLAYQPST